MSLPIAPPLQPMLAKAVSEVPVGPEWIYEPKWDGFRVIIFRDGDDVVLNSRSGKDLGRYFPEMLDAARAELPERCVIDGELVVVREIDGRARLDWEALSERIHPAESRVRMLAEKYPSRFVAFDALALGSENLMEQGFSDRRDVLLGVGLAGPSCHVSRSTTDAALAQQWFVEFEGAGLDGVIGKRAHSHYLPSKREMVKVKHARTADVVLMGYRIHKSGNGIGSLLLGLYHDGELVMIGGASAFTAARRVEILNELEPLRLGDDVVNDGEASRWASGADKRWIPVRPERVLEVAYDQMEGPRLRHAARFLRWRTDREPRSCTYDQLEVPIRYDLADVLGA